MQHDTSSLAADARGGGRHAHPDESNDHAGLKPIERAIHLGAVGYCPINLSEQSDRHGHGQCLWERRPQHAHGVFGITYVESRLIYGGATGDRRRGMLVRAHVAMFCWQWHGGWLAPTTL